MGVPKLKFTQNRRFGCPNDEVGNQCSGFTNNAIKQIFLRLSKEVTKEITKLCFIELSCDFKKTGKDFCI